MLVALVTCATLPALDPDDQLLIEPLRTLGVKAVAAVWDDATVDWASFDAVVIRNTWDYPARRNEFLAWTKRVPSLANPADVIAWNTDKRYLAELSAAGVPVVPTSWITSTDRVVLPPRGRHVLKPSVGAGSLDAAAFSMHDEHEARLAGDHAARLIDAGQTVMLQPYLEGIEAAGEICLIFIGGQFSHAVNKGAMLAGNHGTEAGGLYVKEAIAARQPTTSERSLAELALASVPGGEHRLLYARVDLVPDAVGEPILMELELTEPSLYLGYGGGAARRFARAIADAAKSAGQIERPGARPSAADPAPSSRRESSPDR